MTSPLLVLLVLTMFVGLLLVLAGVMYAALGVGLFAPEFIIFIIVSTYAPEALD